MKVIPILVILFLSITNALAGHRDEKPIFHESDLRDWCESESRNYFTAKGITPHNWTSKWWNKGNILHVKGQWKINGDRVKVKCHIGKGGKTKYAKMEVLTDGKLE